MKNNPLFQGGQNFAAEFCRHFCNCKHRGFEKVATTDKTRASASNSHLALVNLSLLLEASSKTCQPT